MSTILDERVILGQTQEDGTVHWVCHCTDDNIAACGLDVTDMEMLSPDVRVEEYDCPLCILAWPDVPICPWGCVCKECGCW